MRNPRKRTRWSLCVLLANGPIMTGCFAMSSYQSARMTEPGPSRATFALSTVGSSEDDDDSRLTVMDLRVRKALVPEQADMGFTATVFTAGAGALVSVGVEPRIAVINNILAVDLPVTWYVAAPLFQVTPGLVATVPLSRQLEVNASARYLALVGADGAPVGRPVYTLGLGLSDDLRRWAIRPEVAVSPLYNEEGQWLVQFGVGIEPPVPARN